MYREGDYVTADVLPDGAPDWGSGEVFAIVDVIGEVRSVLQTNAIVIVGWGDGHVRAHTANDVDVAIREWTFVGDEICETCRHCGVALKERTEQWVDCKGGLRCPGKKHNTWGPRHQPVGSP